ncbi:hypothetical protein BH23BAC4_BH23BAC4_03410 [soil metagenome]
MVAFLRANRLPAAMMRRLLTAAGLVPPAILPVRVPPHRRGPARTTALANPESLRKCTGKRGLQLPRLGLGLNSESRSFHSSAEGASAGSACVWCGVRLGGTVPFRF